MLTSVFFFVGGLTMNILKFLRDLLFFCSIAILASHPLVIDCYTDPPQSVSIQEDISQLENITNSASSNQITDNANPLFKKTQLTVAQSTELKQSPNVNAPNLGILLPGERVEVIAFHSEWYAVLFNSYVVYIAAEPTINNQEIVIVPEKEDVITSTKPDSSDSDLTIEPTPPEAEIIQDTNKKPVLQNSNKKEEAEQNNKKPTSNNTNTTPNNSNKQPISADKNNQHNNLETKPENSVVEPVYKTVNEAVYATANVNVREAANTTCKILGLLEKNTSIVRIGVGDNGWSKVKYNNKTAYISSKYLTTKKPQTSSNISQNNNSNTSKPSDSSNKNDIVYYNTVDEYVYVTASSLNIRSGPSTECKIIGKLKKNTKVHRIAVSDCGWSKIEYNNITGHVSSKYLSNGNVQQEKPPTQNTISVIDEIKTRDGMYARLTIPDVDFSVALFDQSISKSSQAIVDREDSAAYLYAKAGWGMDIIADHNFQGLERMKASVPNQTYAYLDFGTHKEKYICVKNFVGQNWKSDLVDTEGKSIKGQNNDGIAMYTCNICYPYVTITFWQKVD